MTGVDLPLTKIKKFKVDHHSERASDGVPPPVKAPNAVGNQLPWENKHLVASENSQNAGLNRVLC
jgi:hypothetical protein